MSNRIQIVAHDTNYGELESESSKELERAQAIYSRFLSHMEHWIQSDGPNRKNAFWLRGMSWTRNGKRPINFIFHVLAEWAKNNANVDIVIQPSPSLKGYMRFGHRDRASEIMILSIAQQLADKLADFKTSFYRAYERNVNVDNVDVRANFLMESLRQETRKLFHDLVTEPLLEIGNKSTPITILCVLEHPLYVYENESLKNFWMILLEEIAQLVSPIKFIPFVTGPPDSISRSILGRNAQVFTAKMEDFVAEDDNDIEIYLADALACVYNNFKAVPGLASADVLPHTGDVKSLAKKCGTWFTYASAVVTFIGDEGVSDPPRQLREVLSSDFRVSSLESIYNLYEEFWWTICEDRDLLAKEAIVAIAFLFEILSVRDLSVLLQITTNEIRKLCDELQCIGLVPSVDPAGYRDDEPIRIFHNSFRDFVVGKVDRRAHENVMAMKCFNMMSKLPTIYDERNARSEPGDSETAVQGMCGASVYACRYWTSHLGEALQSSPEIQRCNDEDKAQHEKLSNSSGNSIESSGISNLANRDRSVSSQRSEEVSSSKRGIISVSPTAALGLFSRCSLLRWIFAMRQLGMLEVATTALANFIVLVKEVSNSKRV